MGEGQAAGGGRISETWWTSEGGSVPEGHSFACEGEAAVDGVSETRSHAFGQYLDKRTPLRVGRGQPVGLYALLHLAGLSRNTSINCATAVGRESP